MTKGCIDYTYPPFGEKSTKMTPGVSSFAMILNGLDPSALSEPRNHDGDYSKQQWVSQLSQSSVR